MSRSTQRLRRLAEWRPSRRTAVWAVLALGLVLLAHPIAAADSDLFSNIGPASQVPRGALMDAYPLGHYQLDHRFSAVKAGLLSGVDVSGIPPTIAVFLANILWQITAFLAQVAITVFTFAFSLDLLGGSSSTGGAGALQPVSRAVQSIYQTTFGAPWLVLGILLAGLWAIWHALVRRRYTETAGSLALSVVFVVIALAFVAQPERTIGSVSRLTNQMSGAFLSLTSRGQVGDQDAAKRDASDQLFHLLIYQPWTVLQFGGLEHCVKTPIDKDHPVSVGVRPLSRDGSRDARLSDQLRRTGQANGDGKTCIDNQRKYAHHFLPFSSDSDQRKAEYEAIRDADTSKLPDEDPAKKASTYTLTGADKPAVDALGKGGQYQRLLLSVVIFVGELGAVLLLGALALGVILAQVLVLLLLAFAPVVLVIAVFPGRGHELFVTWLSRLAGFLLRKAIYSLILAVLLTVAAAMQSATTGLGWLLAWGLQAAFFWTVLVTRKQLVGQLTQATTGPAGREDSALRVAAIYGTVRAATRRLPGRTPTTPPTAVPPAPRRETHADQEHAAPPPALPAAPAPEAEDPGPIEETNAPATGHRDAPDPPTAPTSPVNGQDDDTRDQRPAPTSPASLDDPTADAPATPTAVPPPQTAGPDRGPVEASPARSNAPIGPDRRRDATSSATGDHPPGPSVADDHDRPAAAPAPPALPAAALARAGEASAHGATAFAPAPEDAADDPRSGPGTVERPVRPVGSPLLRELDRDTTVRPGRFSATDDAASATVPPAADGPEPPAHAAPLVPRHRDDASADPGLDDGPASPPEVAS